MDGAQNQAVAAAEPVSGVVGEHREQAVLHRPGRHLLQGITGLDVARGHLPAGVPAYQRRKLGAGHHAARRQLERAVDEVVGGEGDGGRLGHVAVVDERHRGVLRVRRDEHAVDHRRLPAAEQPLHEHRGLQDGELQVRVVQRLFHRPRARVIHQRQRRVVHAGEDNPPDPGLLRGRDDPGAQRRGIRCEGRDDEEHAVHPV
jgi:hypothetical protein